MFPILLLISASFAQPPSQAPSGWRVSQTALGKTLTLPAEEMIADGKGQMVRPEMVLWCEGGKVRMQLQMGVGAESISYVRLDQMNVAETRWTWADGSKDVLRVDKIEESGYLGVRAKDTKDLIGQMIVHPQVAVRFMPFGSAPVEVPFRADGLSETLVSACQWEP